MALDLYALRMFLEVAKLGSFTRAGARLGVSKSRASLLVSGLERELGVGLLSRSTRAVQLTTDGEAFMARAERVLADADELGAMFEQPRTLRGQLRVDLPVKLACSFVIPHLAEFHAAHPELELRLSTTDRRVDVLRDGFDCVLRVGQLGDSGLSVRRLGTMSMVNCASPAYLRRYGTPRSLADLDAHRVVCYSLDIGAGGSSFEYREGERYVSRPVRSTITVNSADAYTAACLAGFGIIQSPRWGMAPYFGTGALVEVLPEHTCEPMPVSILHAYPRNMPRRVRVFINWLADLLGPQLR